MSLSTEIAYFFLYFFSWKIPLHTFLYVHKISAREHSHASWSKYTLLQSCSTSRISRWNPGYTTLPCSFSLNSAGKTHRFMSCPGAMTCSKLVLGLLLENWDPRRHWGTLCKACLYHKGSRQCTLFKSTNKAWHLDLPGEKPYLERDLWCGIYPITKRNI